MCKFMKLVYIFIWLSPPVESDFRINYTIKWFQLRLKSQLHFIYKQIVPSLNPISHYYYYYLQISYLDNV
jgi:hypothetical protein